MFATNLCRLSANTFSFPFRSFKKIVCQIQHWQKVEMKQWNVDMQWCCQELLSIKCICVTILARQCHQNTYTSETCLHRDYDRMLGSDLIFIPMHVVTFLHRPVNMNPQIPQPTHSASAGQILAQISRQNVAPQQVNQSSTTSPLHGGPTGGWPGAGPAARPQFNNQVN